MGGGIAVGAVAVSVNDEAKHAWTAAQRSYRVAATLALNIKEYKQRHARAMNPTDPGTATATRSSAMQTPTTRSSSKHATSAAPNAPCAPSRATAPSSSSWASTSAA